MVGRSWLGKKLLRYLECTVPLGLIRNLAKFPIDGRKVARLLLYGTRGGEAISVVLECDPSVDQRSKP